MSADEVDIRVYDKARGFVCTVGAPLLLTATPRHNAQPTAQLTVAPTFPGLADLAAKGARVVIRYRDEHLVGGMCRLTSTRGRSAAERRFVFEVADDWRLLTRILCWPVPGSAITSQSGAEYHVLSGPAETVAKTLIGANAARLGLPVTVAPSLGRGATIKVKARMTSPADVLLPALDQAGIGLTVRQEGTSLVLDAYEPDTFPVALSEAAGTVYDVEWAQAAPETTRAVLGADGDGTARAFRALAATALEGEWGDVVERFVEARDLDVADGAFTADATARMQEALTAGAPTSGISFKLSETETFRYGGDGVHVGDRVAVEIDPAVDPLEDVLRAATLTWSAEAGTRVTPVVGERTDDTTKQLAAALAAVARAQRIQSTRS